MYEREIGEVVAEWQRLVGVPLADVWQPARDRLVVGWRDGTLGLMVPRGADARLHTIRSRPDNPARPFSFQGALRARLGGVTRAIHKVPGEREVRFTFERGALVLRLTGKSGGLWLLEDGVVVASSEGPAPEQLPALPDRPPLPDPPRFSPVDGSWDLGARRYFEAREADGRLEALRRDAVGALTERLRRDARLHERLLDDLARTLQAPVLRRRAELLAGNLWQVRRGESTVSVEDWDTGEQVVLTWEARLAPAQVVERWMDHARRLERAREQLTARLEALNGVIEGWRAALSRAGSATEADLRGWIRERPRRPAPAGAGPWWEWVGPHGARARVGRDEVGNRKLVFQASRGHQVWMHLRDRSSAHVVLPLERGETPSLPHLLAGAQLLLDRAHVGAGEAQEVQYAWVRDLRSVPGTTAGVTVSGEKVLRVVSDAAHLAGWTRLDEP